jgi:hypothetical protein
MTSPSPTRVHAHSQFPNKRTKVPAVNRSPKSYSKPCPFATTVSPCPRRALSPPTGKVARYGITFIRCISVGTEPQLWAAGLQTDKAGLTMMISALPLRLRAMIFLQREASWEISNYFYLDQTLVKYQCWMTGDTFMRLVRC